MRVLWFVNTPFTGRDIGTHVAGGRGGWLTNLAGLVHSDLDLHIACISPSRRATDESAGITTHYLEARNWRVRLYAKSIFNFQSLSEFRLADAAELINRTKPDLIHIHGTEKGYIELLKEYSSIKAPFLISFQGVLTSIASVFSAGYGTEYLKWHFYDRGGRLGSIFPKTYMSDIRLLEKRAARERKFLKLARYTDGRTSYDRDVSSILAPNATYFHIDRPLREPFYKAFWRGPFKTRRVFTTLSDSLIKGLDLIVETAILLRSILSDFSWRIAGVAENANTVVTAKRKFGKHFPSESITFLGNLPPKELASELENASIYVTASHAENSPNALAEAQLVGAPCVATFVGGIPSYLDHGTAGLLVPPRDACALAGAVLRILNDTTYAATLGRRGREIALQRHNLETIRTQLLHAYYSIAR